MVNGRISLVPGYLDDEMYIRSSARLLFRVLCANIVFFFLLIGHKISQNCFLRHQKYQSARRNLVRTRLRSFKHTQWSFAMFSMRCYHINLFVFFCSFNYGDRFWSVKKKEFYCECGSTRCKYRKPNSQHIALSFSCVLTISSSYSYVKLFCQYFMLKNEEHFRNYFQSFLCTIFSLFFIAQYSMISCK